MASLSKNKIKYIHSLELKKIRKEERVFLAEGPKLVGDLLGHFPCRFLAATSSWLQEHPDIDASELVEVSQEDLSRASLLKTPQQVLAIFEQPQYTLDPEAVRQSLCLALDDVQDPGNLGTIIRAGEGAGITGVVMSSDTADIYNPKVIRSTMGSVLRVPFVYASDLKEACEQMKKAEISLYAAHLKGMHNYDQEDYTKDTGFLIGNEAKGLTDEMAAVADTYIKIPMAGQVESLNAAVASSVLMFEAARQRRNS